jgi:multiple sugar transport system permease protein
MLMVAPVVLLMAIFTIYPFAHALYESTQLSSPILPPKFVGLENYTEVIGSQYFGDSLRATARFSAITTPLLVVFGMLVALLLNERFFGNSVLRAGLILPWAIPASLTGIIWKWMFLDGLGAFNYLLYQMGIIDKYIPWLTTPWLAILVVSIAFVWSQLPLVSTLLLAALQAVPDQLYEAASIDGAGPLDRFRHITLPGIQSMLFIVGIYAVMMSLTSFDVIFSLTHGGPGTATSVISYFTWAESFKMMFFGHGAALAIMIGVTAFLGIFAMLLVLPKNVLLGESE